MTFLGPENRNIHLEIDNKENYNKFVGDLKANSEVKENVSASEGETR